MVSKESQHFRGHDDMSFVSAGRILRLVEAFENVYALKREGITCVNEESVFPLYAPVNPGLRGEGLV